MLTKHENLLLALRHTGQLPSNERRFPSLANPFANAPTNYVPVKHERKRVRVLESFYADDRIVQPGDEIELSQPDAATAVAHKRAEFL